MDVPNTERRKALEWWRPLTFNEKFKLLTEWKEKNSHDLMSKWAFEMINASSGAIQAIYKWHDIASQKD